VAVIGQFKSGKSSLLNAVLGERVFPVGALPVTAVITRASAGPALAALVTHLDGTIEEILPGRLAEFVTEAGNPENHRQVAAVDVFTPAMEPWRGLRLVDTPGLGSVFAHNTETTRKWMPNVAVALVTVSAERPLSEEDRRLIKEARETAPRVVVLLTKVDLLSDTERPEVLRFLEDALRKSFDAAIPVQPFSSRVEPEHWVRGLEDTVLRPVASNVADERRKALTLKMDSLVRSCRGYLAVGLDAAERVEEDRERLRRAVFNESVNSALIKDELRLAEQRICGETRPAFEKLFHEDRAAVEARVTNDLRAELRTWTGNLAKQARRYEGWMAERLEAELKPLSEGASPRALELLSQAEARFRRVVEAFRDRLTRNVREATGVTISPVSWEVKRPKLTVIPIALSQTFMTHWDLLWWLLPMRLVGGIFRRHVLGLVAWEVEKNLARLAGDWARAADGAVADLRAQAIVWVETELSTIHQLLDQKPTQAGALRGAIRQLDELSDVVAG
jgi:GTP-binding protein EngB required for normal cell division